VTDEYGNYTDEEGYLVNEYGEYIDEYGDVLETDAEGNVIASQGGSVFDGLIPGEGKVLEDMGGAPEGQCFFTDDSLGLSFYSMDYWNAVAKRADPSIPFNTIMLRPDGETEQRLYVVITDYTKEYNAYIDAGGLDGDEALVGFVTKILGQESLSADMFGEFVFHDVIKEANGTYSYSCEFTSNSDSGDFGWAYINIDDSIGKTHAVYVTGSVTDYNFYIDDINVITESLVSYTTAVG
jgi:hypothetical protein